MFPSQDYCGVQGNSLLPHVHYKAAMSALQEKILAEACLSSEMDDDAQHRALLARMQSSKIDDPEQSTLKSDSSNENANDPFGDFENHCNAARKSTVVALSISLRESHPDHVLTVILKSECDLLAFAEAGFAHSEPDLNTGLKIRTFCPPPNQLDGAKGMLDRKIVLEKHMYGWCEYEFLLYLADCYQEPGFCTQVYSFILAKPEGKETSETGSAPADALVQIASQWTLELHHEIWMFDQLVWQKNKQLWFSVQDALWNNVILDEAKKGTIRDDIEGFFDERDTYQEYGVPWKVSIVPLFITSQITSRAENIDYPEDIYCLSLACRSFGPKGH